MKNILIIGAGAMGSAFTFPCIDNGNNVVLVGTPLENNIIDIEVNPEILISFDEVQSYKFSGIDKKYIREINSKCAGLNSSEKFKWLSKRSDRNAGYIVSIKDLNFSEKTCNLYSLDLFIFEVRKFFWTF